jgi:hypothetical protein
MGRMVAIVATVTVALAGTASVARVASARPASPARATSERSRTASAPSACPAGVPVQTITFVNQAHVRPAALARLERALTAQSLQLRAAWGTPCAQFGPGGWKLYLKVGGYAAHGEHYFDGMPYAIVWTSGAPLEGWSRDCSHELLEMLEDPTLDVRYYRDSSTWMREVVDPVEWAGYSLDGVYVSDFVLPAWYAGASTATDIACLGSTCTDYSPLLAPAGNAGPWDEMHLLTGPWQLIGPDLD